MNPGENTSKRSRARELTIVVVAVIIVVIVGVAIRTGFFPRPSVGTMGAVDAQP